MASVEPTASTTQSTSTSLISHSSSTSTTSTAVATTTASSSNPASDTTPSAAAVSGAPFYLLCSVCRWDSLEIGLTFDKASGLACNIYIYIYIINDFSFFIYEKIFNRIFEMA